MIYLSCCLGDCAECSKASLHRPGRLGGSESPMPREVRCWPCIANAVKLEPMQTRGKSSLRLRLPEGGCRRSTPLCGHNINYVGFSEPFKKCPFCSILGCRASMQPSQYANPASVSVAAWELLGAVSKHPVRPWASKSYRYFLPCSQDQRVHVGSVLVLTACLRQWMPEFGTSWRPKQSFDWI